MGAFRRTFFKVESALRQQFGIRSDYPEGDDFKALEDLLEYSYQSKSRFWICELENLFGVFELRVFLFGIFRVLVFELGICRDGNLVRSNKNKSLYRNGKIFDYFLKNRILDGYLDFNSDSRFVFVKSHAYDDDRLFLLLEEKSGFPVKRSLISCTNETNN